MKGLLKYLGVALIILGVVVYAVDYFFKCNSNAMLIIGLVLVLAGVAGQIVTMKKEGQAD